MSDFTIGDVSGNVTIIGPVTMKDGTEVRIDSMVRPDRLNDGAKLVNYFVVVKRPDSDVTLHSTWRGLQDALDALNSWKDDDD